MNIYKVRNPEGGSAIIVARDAGSARDAFPEHGIDRTDLDVAYIGVAAEHIAPQILDIK